MATLTLLRDGEMYGYQLVQELSNRSGGRLVTQDSSLYPVLYRMREQGLIESCNMTMGKRMNRVYYRLTPKGEAKLCNMLREYEAVTDGMLRILKGEEIREGKK